MPNDNGIGNFDRCRRIGHIYYTEATSVGCDIGVSSGNQNSPRTTGCQTENANFRRTGWIGDIKDSQLRGGHIGIIPKNVNAKKSIVRHDVGADFSNGCRIANIENQYRPLNVGRPRLLLSNVSVIPLDENTVRTGRIEESNFHRVRRNRDIKYLQSDVNAGNIHITPRRDDFVWIRRCETGTHLDKVC